jgi:hypothetical protein
MKLLAENVLKLCSNIRERFQLLEHIRIFCSIFLMSRMWEIQINRGSQDFIMTTDFDAFKLHKLHFLFVFLFREYIPLNLPDHLLKYLLLSIKFCCFAPFIWYFQLLLSLSLSLSLPLSRQVMLEKTWNQYCISCLWYGHMVFN